MIQPDGKILVAGATHNGTDWDWYIVRLMPDGALDGTFGTGGIVTTDLRGFNDWGTSIALQPDGKIVFGSKSSNGTDTDFAVARYNPDGSLDGTFGTGGKVFTPIGSGNDDGSRVTLQPDGKIVLARLVRERDGRRFRRRALQHRRKPRQFLWIGGHRRHPDRYGARPNLRRHRPARRKDRRRRP